MNKIEENLLLSGIRFAKIKEYWINKLSGDISETRILITDKDDTDSEISKSDVGKVDIPLPDHLTSQIIKLSKNSDLSIYLILLTGLKSLIHRYTGDKDIIVLSPTYKKIASEETINNFILIRDQINGSDSMRFKELLLAVRQSTQEAYDNQDYPFNKLIEYFIDPNHTQNPYMFSNVVCSLTTIHGEVSTGGLEDKIFFFLYPGSRKNPGGNSIQS